MSGLPARRKLEQRTQSESGLTSHRSSDDAPQDEAAGESAPHGRPAHDPDAWKAFGRDTEAGRMLSKIYGGNTKPKIDYPKPRTKPRKAEDTPAFMPAGGKAEIDYRTATRKEANITVPNVGHGERYSFAPIELRDGRGVMKKDEIERKIVEDERTADKMFPPISKAISTESEKRKLQAMFQFKGGKALPEELTLAPIEGHVPLEMVASHSGVAKRRAAKSAGSTRGGGTGTAPSAAKVSQDQALHIMILDIAEEISERQQYLDEMRRLGSLSRDQEGTIMGEISQRVAELNRLNAQLAKS